MVKGIVYTPEARVAEFKVDIVGYAEDGTLIVVYRATTPAEIYTVPNTDLES